MGNFFIYQGIFLNFLRKIFLQYISHFFFQKYNTIHSRYFFGPYIMCPSGLPWVLLTRTGSEYPVTIHLGESISVRRVKKNIYIQYNTVEPKSVYSTCKERTQAWRHPWQQCFGSWASPVDGLKLGRRV